MKEKTIF